MIIIVKTLTGKKLQFEVEPRDAIESLKIKIQEKEGIPPPNQILTFNGRRLEDENWLLDYKIIENSTLNLSITIRGHNPSPIFIKDEYEMIKIEICFCHNLEQLKSHIKNQIGFCKNLYINGKILEDESKKKNLHQLGIRVFSILDFDGRIDNCDYKGKFKNELAQLKDMGFHNEEKNIQILKVSGGNISYAIQHYYQYLK